jgi:hypothetical protein
MITPRSLPIRVDPIPGEGLDSWLEALSRRLDTSARDLLAALGLAEPHERRRIPTFTVYLRHDEAARVAAATGLTPAVLEEMTLAHFDPMALRIDRARRSVARNYSWGRRRGTWFCPRCLTENGGRWLLRWRLGWSFACTRHRCLLAERCPTCERTPQRGALWLNLPKAATCAEHPASAGRAWARCGTDLTTTPVLEFTAEHPVLVAQQVIDATITSGTATFGLYTATPAASLFSDLTLLAARILRTTPAPSPHDPDLGQLAHDYPVATSGPGASGATSPAHAALTAIAVVRALRVLHSPIEDIAAETLTAMGTHDTRAWQVGNGPEPANRLNITPVLARVLHRVDRARVDVLGGPQRCLGRDRTGQLPTVFWPWWTLRLTPAWRVHRQIRTVLSCLVLACGTTLSISRAAAALGDAVSAGYVAASLQRLSAEPAWPAIRSAIIRIADHLDTYGSPIDYARRRALDYTDLLPTPQWDVLCARTGLRHSHATLRATRCVLFESLSGLPANLAPNRYAPTSLEQRRAVADFPLLLTTTVADELTRVAAEFLDAHGIEEPLTWQPPQALADGLELIGMPADAGSLVCLHNMLDAGIPFGRAAVQAGMSLDAARYLLTAHPRTKDIDPVDALLRTSLPPARLRDMYLTQGWSLTALAAHLHVNRRRITRLAIAYGIPLREVTTTTRQPDVNQTESRDTMRRVRAPRPVPTPRRCLRHGRR